MTISAMLEFEHDDRHLAYFHVGTRAGNTLGWLLMRDGKYLLLSRVRTYVDDVVGPESQDRRTGYLVTFESSDDEQALAKAHALCDRVATAAASLAVIWGLPRVTFHQFTAGTWEEVTDTLRLDEGFHVLTAREVKA